MDQNYPVYVNYDRERLVGWIRIPHDGSDLGEHLGEMVLAPEGKLVDGQLEVTGFGLIPKDQYRPIDLSANY